MEFGAGFVAGGLLAGLAAAKSGAIFQSANDWLHVRLGKADAAIKREAAAKAESLQSKL